jgi:hypothetical protein
VAVQVAVSAQVLVVAAGLLLRSAHGGLNHTIAATLDQRLIA